MVGWLGIKRGPCRSIGTTEFYSSPTNKKSLIMKTTILSVACLAITLGLALADYSSYGSYGSYGGGYGGGYGGYGGGIGLGYALPYAPPQGAVGGIGQGGLLMLIGFLFLFTLLLNSSIFNFTSSSTSTSTPITLVG